MVEILNRVLIEKNPSDDFKSIGFGMTDCRIYMLRGKNLSNGFQNGDISVKSL